MDKESEEKPSPSAQVAPRPEHSATIGPAPIPHKRTANPRLVAALRANLSRRKAQAREQQERRVDAADCETLQEKL